MPDRSIHASGKSVTKVLIWDAEGSPPLGEWMTVLWRGFADGMTPNSVSIPSLIEENADNLRARYLAWVYELGETRIQGQRMVDHLELKPGINYWWMTSLVEKCNYSKSPQIDTAMRLLAFTAWAVCRDIAKITLASANQPLAKCMRTWCQRSGVPFEWQRVPKPSVPLSWVRRAYSALPIAVQAMTWLPRYLFDRWPLRGVGLGEWRQTEGRVTFVSYLLNLVPDAAKVGRYESRYWAGLPDVLQDQGRKTNWLHLYEKDTLLPTAYIAAETLRTFNKTGRGVQSHIALDAFLSVKVILKALTYWGGLAWTGKQLQDLACSSAEEKLDLWPLFVDDWRQSMIGVTALSNSLNLALFEAAIWSLPRQQVGVYLQENQGWEFGLIQLWKAAGQGRLIGTPHSTVRFWDLRYFFDPRSYRRLGAGGLPLPDQVALNGKAATDAYLVGGYPAKDLVQVEALRYLYLDEIAPRATANSSTSKKCLRLLVLCDYLATNTRSQMILLEQAAAALPAGTIITVKPHPACPINAEDYPSLRMTIAKQPIASLLAECDVAYTSAVTSAAVDAYCAGVPVISILDPNILNLSPLRGRDGVFFASTPVELREALLSAVSPSLMTAAKVDFFTCDRDLRRWRKLLNECAGAK